MWPHFVGKSFTMRKFIYKLWPHCGHIEIAKFAIFNVFYMKDLRSII